MINLHSHPRSAFSLVELSIVLVILGLLVGGVLSGQSLIKAAQLRSIAQEHDKFIAATNTFKDKYFALPGDMNNATAFWGKNNAVCPAHTGTASATGTCNGNGDGQVLFCTNFGGGDATCPEDFTYWQQLALAGMIEGTYAGTGVGSVSRSTAGSSAPGTKFSSNAVWVVGNINIVGGNPVYYTMNFGNVLSLSNNGTDALNGAGAVISPADAWNIDKKIDDGMPGTGKLIATYSAPLGCAWNAAPAGCPTSAQLCSTATGSTDYAGVYAVQNTDLNCYLQFPNAF